VAVLHLIAALLEQEVLLIPEILLAVLVALILVAVAVALVKANILVIRGLVARGVREACQFVTPTLLMPLYQQPVHQQ
jgi:hypothetical protein